MLPERSSFNYSRECEWTLGGGPLEKERNVCLWYTHYCESSKSMEGDHDKDRVDDAVFLHPFRKVHTRNCSFKFFQILQARWQTEL